MKNRSEKKTKKNHKIILAFGACVAVILVVSGICLLASKHANSRPDSGDFVIVNFGQTTATNRGDILKVKGKDILFEAGESIWNYLESKKQEAENSLIPITNVGHYELTMPYALTVNGEVEYGEILFSSYSGFSTVKKTSYRVGFDFTNYQLLVTINWL